MRNGQRCQGIDTTDEQPAQDVHCAAPAEFGLWAEIPLAGTGTGPVPGRMRWLSTFCRKHALRVVEAEMDEVLQQGWSIVVSPVWANR